MAGREEGREEGLAEGVHAQQQTLLKLLQWRFQLSAQEQASFAQQISAIEDLPRLSELVNQMLAASSVQDFVGQLGQPGDSMDANEQNC